MTAAVPPTPPLPTDLNDTLPAARQRCRLRVTYYALFLKTNIEFPAFEYE